MGRNTFSFKNFPCRVRKGSRPPVKNHWLRVTDNMLLSNRLLSQLALPQMIFLNLWLRRTLLQRHNYTPS